MRSRRICRHGHSLRFEYRRKQIFEIFRISFVHALPFYDPSQVKIFASRLIKNNNGGQWPPYPDQIFFSLMRLSAAWASTRRDKRRVAGVTGLEPAASGVTGQRSNQLSYTPPKTIHVFVSTNPFRRFYQLIRNTTKPGLKKH